MKYAILVILMVFLATTVFAGEANLTLANRELLKTQMINDNDLVTNIQTSGSITKAKAQTILTAFAPVVMAWLDSKLTFDKIVKKTAEDNTVTYWHKIRQLKLETDMIQIDVLGNTALKSELESLKTKATQEYNAKINAIQSQIDAIPTAAEDTNE
jgi:hypothetical protein